MCLLSSVFSASASTSDVLAGGVKGKQKNKKTKKQKNKKIKK